jgi:hypothetical protein
MFDRLDHHVVLPESIQYRVGKILNPATPRRAQSIAAQGGINAATRLIDDRAAAEFRCARRVGRSRTSRFAHQAQIRGTGPLA